MTLHKNFGKLEVLRGVDCRTKPKEVVVVMGPSGSGKSTFLRCLNVLKKPTGGEIIVDGFNLTDRSANINKVREEVGMVVVSVFIKEAGCSCEGCPASFLLFRCLQIIYNSS